MSIATGAQGLGTDHVPACAITSATQHVVGFNRWKDYVHDHFPWLEHRNHTRSPFEAQVTSWRVSSLALATIRADASEVIRTRHLAESSDSGFIKVLWQQAGTLTLEQDGKHCTVVQGEFAVCDTTRPYRIGLSEGACFSVLMAPHDVVAGWNEISAVVCGSKLADRARPQAAFGALIALAELPNEIIESEADPVFWAVLRLISASLRQSAGHARDTASNDSRLNKARRHILANLGDPGLHPDTIASALCMSRRSLYMLFKDHDVTPAKMIHDLRLDEALRSIEDERNRHRKMTDLAFDVGFADYATFSRLFRARYGITPSEHRLRRRIASVGLSAQSI